MTDRSSVATGLSDRFSTYCGAKMGTTRSRTSPLGVLRTGRMLSFPVSTVRLTASCWSSESERGVTSVDR